MGFFSDLKANYKFARSAIRVNKAFSNNGLKYTEENKIIINFLAKYELVRKEWNEILELKDNKQKIALFSLIYYLLEIQFGGKPYYWASDKLEMTHEEDKIWSKITDLIEYPMEVYLVDVLNNNIGKSFENPKLTFEKYSENLYINDFFSLMSLENDKYNLLPKYLLTFFHSDAFTEVRIQYNDDGDINLEKLNSNLDDIILKTPNLGLSFDKVQLELIKIKGFIKFSLRNFFNNPFFSMKENLSVLLKF